MYRLRIGSTAKLKLIRNKAIQTGQMLRVITLLMILAVSGLLCSCKIRSGKDLIKYANAHYGKAEFIREEHGGEDEREYCKVYLRDMETGIEYEVTSGMSDINIDGSSFGYLEHTFSNFETYYHEYLLEEASEDLARLEAENSIDIEIEYDTVVIDFADREHAHNAEEVAKETDSIIAGHDVKDLRITDYLLYVDDKVYVGSYDAVTQEYTASNDYRVIDHVCSSYDSEAVFEFSSGAYIDQFLSPDEIDKMFPGHTASPSGKAYYFINSDGEEFIAVDLSEFGVKNGEIRLYRDTLYGMEEIDY